MRISRVATALYNCAADVVLMYGTPNRQMNEPSELWNFVFNFKIYRSFSDSKKQKTTHFFMLKTKQKA